MEISYKPLWHTLLEQGMSKEDLRIKAKLTTNAIANMGMNIPVRRRRLSGNPGSKSPAEWEA